MKKDTDHAKAHKKRKEEIREKLKKMRDTKDNQRIYHELMETL